MEANCGETYSAYKKALKKNWHRIDETRKEQAALEQCWRQYKGYNQEAEVRAALALGNTYLVRWC